MEILVSIIVPIFNVEQYLQRCLKSIVNQSYKNIEIILIDDGSEDGCPEICDNWKAKDKRINVIHQTNRGLSAARNVGLSLCKGDYITFIDSDDFIDLSFIEDAITIIKKENSDFIHFEYQEFKIVPKNNAMYNSDFKYNKISNENAIKRLFLTNKNSVVWANVYSINLFKDLIFDDKIRYAEDMFIIHKLFKEATNIIFIDKIGYYYSQEGNSLVRSKFNVNKLLVKDATSEWVEFCKIHYPNLVDRAYAYYLTTTINLCSNLINENQTDILNEYENIINENYMTITKSKYISRNDKLKAFLLKHKLNAVYKILLRVADRRRKNV